MFDQPVSEFDRYCLLYISVDPCTGSVFSRLLDSIIHIFFAFVLTQCLCLCVSLCKSCFALCIVCSGCGVPRPDDNAGQILKKDDVQLFEISSELALDMAGLQHFSACLLDRSGCQKTADVFLAGLDPYKYATIPAKVTALLKYW